MEKMKKLFRRWGAVLGAFRWARIELAAAAALGAVLALELGAARADQRALAEDVIRLHVVADADESEAQRLKLCVRDRILAVVGDELAAASDADEAERIVRGALEEIRSAAEDTLAAEGCSLPVRAEVTRDRFPQRTYGGVTLPAGEYTALRVVIGRGAGRNWWCVMFPPLCAGAEEDGGSAAAGELDGEWRLATEDTPEIRFRLRLLEVLEDLRARWHPARPEPGPGRTPGRGGAAVPAAAND